MRDRMRALFRYRIDSASPVTVKGEKSGRTPGQVGRLSWMRAVGTAAHPVPRSLGVRMAAVARAWSPGLRLLRSRPVVSACAAPARTSAHTRAVDKATAHLRVVLV